MQTLPRCFEIAEKRNALRTLNLDGTKRETDLVPTPFTDLAHDEWTVPVDAFGNFTTLGILTPSVIELLAHSLRLRLSRTSDCFLRHDLLRNRKMSLMMKTQRRRAPVPLPRRTFLRQTFPMNSEPIIERADDNTLGDGIIIIFVYAAFLGTPLTDTKDAASKCLFQAET